MKAQIISKTGKSGEIEMPELFKIQIREDIAQKLFEIGKRIQPYAPFWRAGKQASASGNLAHGRRLWKTTYGHGISRVPRKIFWRRGDHFYWVGAEIASARKGRQAHPPRVEQFENFGKMNKKERIIGIQSAIAATASLDYFKKRYSSLFNEKISLPIVVESKVLEMKSKEFFKFLQEILGKAFAVALQKKVERAGKGKIRNRRYKKNAGLLLVIGNDEKFKITGIEVKQVKDLELESLWPLGRLTVYTEKAIKNLGEIK